MQLIPHISFNGDGRLAIDFYTKIFNGTVKELCLYSDYQQICDHLPTEWHSKIMHATLATNDFVIILSDTIDINNGGKNQISLSLHYTDKNEQTKIFNQLSVNGDVIMPLQDNMRNTRFGIVIDKFGVKWMLNYDKLIDNI